MTKKNKQPPSTRDFVQIADIRETVLILKNGSLRSILEVNSMNFELKSADEQVAIVRAFQNFLNAVDFPVQIAVSSRKLDINPYLKSLDEVIEKQENELLRIQAVEYTRFVRGLTELVNIMSKKFYIVVPFYVIESLAGKTSFFDALKSIFAPSKFLKTLSDEELETYKTQLNQRIDIIIEGIGGMGLGAKLLDKDEMMSLFYQYYNPGHSLSTP
ncbi:MAG: hypothetical protein AAB585_02675 [Patescibacteria group bacterium]